MPLLLSSFGGCKRFLVFLAWRCVLQVSIFMVTWSVPALCVSVQAPVSQAGCQLPSLGPSQVNKHLSTLAMSPLSYYRGVS